MKTHSQLVATAAKIQQFIDDSMGRKVMGLQEYMEIRYIVGALLWAAGEKSHLGPLLNGALEYSDQQIRQE